MTPAEVDRLAEANLRYLVGRVDRLAAHVRMCRQALKEIAEKGQCGCERKAAEALERTDW
jgi:hypothetical protein